MTGLALAMGADAESRRRAGERLARLASERIRGGDSRPTRNLDDREVSIDDPSLEVPVWWLGERWSGGGGLPELERAYTFAPFPVDPRSGPGNSAEVQYDGCPPRKAPPEGSSS